MFAAGAVDPSPPGRGFTPCFLRGLVSERHSIATRIGKARELSLVLHQETKSLRQSFRGVPILETRPRISSRT